MVNENDIKKALHEELTRGDVRSMINSEIEDYLRDAKFKKAVKNITADVLEDFLDNLWKRKAYWKGTIKRS